jgi:hypothetical protein
VVTTPTTGSPGPASETLNGRGLRQECSVSEDSQRVSVEVLESLPKQVESMTRLLWWVVLLEYENGSIQMDAL